MSYADGLKYVESLDGVEALWVMNDGTINYSSGFKAFIKE
jgi:thiamine biosynthesis lipoprotein